jgi:hypothetical protein
MWSNFRLRDVIDLLHLLETYFSRCNSLVVLVYIEITFFGYYCFQVIEVNGQLGVLDVILINQNLDN